MVDVHYHVPHSVPAWICWYCWSRLVLVDLACWRGASKGISGKSSVEGSLAHANEDASSLAHRNEDSSLSVLKKNDREYQSKKREKNRRQKNLISPLSKKIDLAKNQPKYKDDRNNVPKEKTKKMCVVMSHHLLITQIFIESKKEVYLPWSKNDHLFLWNNEIFYG